MVEFNQIKVHGKEALGGYAFTFSLSGARLACDPPVYISSITVSLALLNPLRSFLAPLPALDVCIHCNQYPSSNQYVHIDAILGSDQLDAIEAARQEGDLELQVQLRALIQDGTSLYGAFDCSTMIIPRDIWLRALKSSGFRRTIVFEVPVPDISEELQSLMSEAQDFIGLGLYNQAVAHCRKVIEALEINRGDKKKASKASEMLRSSSEREAMTIIDRMLAMREQIKNITQLGVHGSEVFTRSQAKAVLGATLSLLAEPTVGFALSRSKVTRNVDEGL